MLCERAVYQAAIVLMRPDIAVTTPTGRWDVSNAHANIGFAVYPFRKEGRA